MPSNAMLTDRRPDEASIARDRKEAGVETTLVSILLAMAWGAAAGHDRAAIGLGGAAIGGVALFRALLGASPPSASGAGVRGATPIAALVLPGLDVALPILAATGVVTVTPIGVVLYSLSLLATLFRPGLAGRPEPCDARRPRGSYRP